MYRINDPGNLPEAGQKSKVQHWQMKHTQWQPNVLETVFIIVKILHFYSGAQLVTLTCFGANMLFFSSSFKVLISTALSSSSLWSRSFSTPSSQEREVGEACGVGSSLSRSARSSSSSDWVCMEVHLWRAHLLSRASSACWANCTDIWTTACQKNNNKKTHKHKQASSIHETLTYWRGFVFITGLCFLVLRILIKWVVKFVEKIDFPKNLVNIFKCLLYPGVHIPKTFKFPHLTESRKHC